MKTTLKLFITTVTAFALSTSNLIAQQDTTVRMTAKLDNNSICPNKQESYLYLNLNGCHVGKRVPLNISVVFDRSGSMEGERMHHGKKAIEYLIDQLEPDDIMSLVIYDHEAYVLHSSEPVTDKHALKRKLEHITPRGTTNLSAGLDLGIQEVVSTYNKNKINRVFLFTDGQPNEGITDHYLLEKIASEHAHKFDVSISTFGLGHEYNEFLMHDIAESGAGNYYYIQTPTDIINVMSMEIQKVKSVVAQNAKLIIDFPTQNLTLSKIYGQPYKIVNGQIYIDLKEIHPEESTGILIKFINSNPSESPITIKSRLTYFSCISQSISVIDLTNTLSQSTDAASCAQQYNSDVLEQMVYYTSHYLLESAVKETDNNNIPAAQRKVAEAKQVISQSPVPPDNSPLLSDQSQIINEYDSHLSTWHTKSETERRHIQKKIHYTNYNLRKNKQ
jgi:Ca-activated chloride channel family protein